MISGLMSKTANEKEKDSAKKSPINPSSNTKVLAGSTTTTQSTSALKNNSSSSNSNANPALSSLDPLSSSSNEINPNDICSPHELIGWVDDVLEKLETKFSRVETEVLERLDVLGKRIDSLELSMSGLLDGASNPNPSAPEHPTTSPPKP